MSRRRFAAHRAAPPFIKTVRMESIFGVMWAVGALALLVVTFTVAFPEGVLIGIAALVWVFFLGLRAFICFKDAHTAYRALRAAKQEARAAQQSP